MSERPLPTFGAYVDEDGALIPDDPKRYSLYLSSLKGQRLTITVKRSRRGRSTSQNSFLWAGVYDEIVAQLFHEREDITADDVHLWAKEKFCPTTTKVMAGGESVSIRSTRLLDVQAMSEYTEKVMAHFASEYGVVFGEGR